MHRAGDMTDRIVTLDALRGFAVMGILAMNIIAFSMPEWAYITPLAYGGETLGDRAAWILSFVLVDGKMRGLFSLLFGASMMLILTRASAAGENALKVHYSRMAWLGIFGLGHYFLIWWGDILFVYACVGSVAFLFRDWEPHRLIKWALVIYSLGMVFWGLQFGGLQVLQVLATAPGASAALAGQYSDIINGPGFATNVAGDLALHRGTWSEIVAMKWNDNLSPFGSVLQSVGETLPMMLLGMALQKNGFLQGAWAKADYARWIKRLVPCGLLLSVLLCAWIVMSGYDVITALAVSMAWSAIPRLMLTIGYAAVLILATGRLAGSAFIQRVAAAGQVAFSNYLGTSLVMTTVFYGYGLGLYGHVSRIELWLVVVVAWTVMLLWSAPWLKRYRYGPLEWLWRSLARGKLQPFRRTQGSGQG